MLTRCLDNERSWRLHTSRRHQLDHGGGGGSPPLFIEGSLPLGPEPAAQTLVFPCILSALRWITQGRDPALATSHQDAGGATIRPSLAARAAALRCATEIHVLVAGSLHLVGGVLKHFDQDK